MIELSPTNLRDFGGLLLKRRSTREFSNRPLALDAVGDALWHGAGETRDRHRVAPSARATYPTAVTLVSGNVDDLDPGVYRYEPRGHGLDLVVDGDRRADVAAATRDARDWLGSCPALLVASANTVSVPSALADQPAVHAERFAWMEVGFIVQNVSVWAAEAGLGAVVIAGFDDVRAQAVSGRLLPAENELLAVIAIGEPAR